MSGNDHITTVSTKVSTIPPTTKRDVTNVVINVMEHKQSISASMSTPTTTVSTTISARSTRRKATRVVALRRKNGMVIQDCDVYIGRACARGGWALKQSKWHNPFSIRQCGGNAAKAVAKFEAMLKNNPKLMAEVKTLRGKVLGCWCKKPNTPSAPCHGDVLARLADETQGD